MSRHASPLKGSMHMRCARLRRSTINLEKFDHHKRWLSTLFACSDDVGIAQQALALVALSLSYLSPPARSFVLFIHGDIGCVCGVCVYGLGVLCAQPSQVGDAHVRHGRGLARRGKLQPIHIST